MKETHRRNRYPSLAFQELHRYAGGVSMTDVDCLEYDWEGNPLAIIEGKHFSERFYETQNRCLTKTAALLNVPYFVIRHNNDLTKFWIDARNPQAEKVISDLGLPMGVSTRRNLLDLLHHLRGRKPYAETIQDFEAAEVEDL